MLDDVATTEGQQAIGACSPPQQSGTLYLAKHHAPLPFPRLTHLSLFAGIGGADIAARWAAIETVAFSEVDPFCNKVLERNFPGIPNLGDIRGISQKEVEDATGFRTVDVISGGFPCQPFSNAGKRRGKEDDRYLWPEMLRVIRELKPVWIIAENVVGFIKLALDDALSDLEAAGYEAGAFVLPACAKGAWHRRERLFIVAHAGRERRVDGTDEEIEGATGEQPFSQAAPGHCMEYDAAPCASKPCRLRWSAPQDAAVSSTKPHENPCRFECLRDGKQWQVRQPPVPGMVDGISSKLDEGRIKALGNAICPAQIYPLFSAIRTLENRGVDGIQHFDAFI
jgi:DNA (cytosine-5)-methyltransferase 1